MLANNPMVDRLINPIIDALRWMIDDNAISFFRSYILYNEDELIIMPINPTSINRHDNILNAMNQLMINHLIMPKIPSFRINPAKINDNDVEASECTSIIQ